VKQELPTLETSWRPAELGSTGIITDNGFSASYLDFKYSNDLKHVHDYNSTRIGYQQRLYKPFYTGPITTTPEVGGVGIYYGNVPEENQRLLALGRFAIESNMPIFRKYDSWKHVIIPYG